MKQYSVTIKEVHERLVTVLASNPREAYDKAADSVGGILIYSWTLDPDIACDVTELNKESAS